QPAQATMVAVAGEGGFEVLVALTLTDSGEHVIYSGDPVPQADLPQAMEEGLNFAESMGFILDATGWSKLDEAHRADLIARIAAFRPPAPREAVAPERPKAESPIAAVARL